MYRFLSLAILLSIAPLITSCTVGPSYTGQQSDHFDGKRFVNRQPMDHKTAGDMLRLGWGALSEAAEWPDWVEIEQQKVARERVYHGLSVTFMNHATFLIQVDGLNILTDPVYSERVSPSQLVGPKRVHAPGVRLADLPPIDVILISHNHYDHLDEDNTQNPAGAARAGTGDHRRPWQWPAVVDLRFDPLPRPRLGTDLRVGAGGVRFPPSAATARGAASPTR